MNKQTINQYIDQLNQIPPEVQRILHEIREKDRKVLELTVQIEPKREYLLERLTDGEQIKTHKEKLKLKQMLEEIQRLQVLQIELSKDKINLAEDLYNIIDEPTEMLEKEIANKYPEFSQGHNPKQRSGKSKRGKQENDWEYQIYEPQYCYCRNASYGEMIMCENPLCETQWFHLNCVEEKINRGEKWFCLSCRKNNSKTKLKKEETKKK